MTRIVGALLLFVLPSALAADSGPALRTATTHPMKYLLSLPVGWTAGKPWPVAVIIPDAARDFEGNLAAFVKARGALPYILVAPHVVTSGGANYRLSDTYRYSDADWKRVTDLGDWRFDEEGISAVLADVRRLYGGEERVFLTGWEAGGHTVWALTFRHPDWLRASAPVSTNWRGRWVADADFSSAPARANLPVGVLFCDRSKAEVAAAWDALFGQTGDAMKIASARGYRNVQLSILSGRVHGPLADDAFAFFETVRATP